jgi:hypothetical protein
MNQSSAVENAMEQNNDVLGFTSELTVRLEFDISSWYAIDRLHDLIKK